MRRRSGSGELRIWCRRLRNRDENVANPGQGACQGNPEVVGERVDWNRTCQEGVLVGKNERSLRGYDLEKA